MISDEKLLEFNSKGYIPGPKETEEIFLERIQLSEKLCQDPIRFFEENQKSAPFPLENKLLKPRWNWTRAQLFQLFDIIPTELAMFYSNKGLRFFQGGATWLVEFGENKISLPLLQFRKRLQKGSYLFFYSLDEILAHEAVHSARIAFNEPKSEEIFAYMTSSRMFRRALGPIIRTAYEVGIFFSFMLMAFVSQFCSIFISSEIFLALSLFSFSTALFMLLFGLFRLALYKLKFNRVFKKLIKIVKDKKKARSILFRLMDKEISAFSKESTEAIKEYFEKNKVSSLRIRLISLAYLS